MLDAISVFTFNMHTVHIQIVISFWNHTLWLAVSMFVCFLVAAASIYTFIYQNLHNSSSISHGLMVYHDRDWLD